MSTVRWDKCPSGTNVPAGQMSSGTNVRGTNVQWDSCPVGQMSCGTIVSVTVVTPPVFIYGSPFPVLKIEFKKLFVSSSCWYIFFALL